MDDLIRFERGNSFLHIGESQDIIPTLGQFDAVITDPPYEIALHGKAWDNTGIAFSTAFWKTVHGALKPGGFLVAFAAPRLYHRLAGAVEDAGFKLYPFLTWQFDMGLPKPVNVSELFDREVPDRKILGHQTKVSGYVDSNVLHGAQTRTVRQFAIKERGVTEESRAWSGFYYGVNCMRPVNEPILLAQKEIDGPRMIDNLRRHGTGALNLGALRERREEWPNTIFSHNKTRKTEHGSDHPSVKPVSLMEELCMLACPPGGRILDPFAGTGTTGVAGVRQGFDVTLIERDVAMDPVIRRRLASA